jgi:hypothetical protein
LASEYFFLEVLVGEELGGLREAYAEKTQLGSGLFVVPCQGQR